MRKKSKTFLLLPGNGGCIKFQSVLLLLFEFQMDFRGLAPTPVKFPDVERSFPPLPDTTITAITRFPPLWTRIKSVRVIFSDSKILEGFLLWGAEKCKIFGRATFKKCWMVSVCFLSCQSRWSRIAVLFI